MRFAFLVACIAGCGGGGRVPFLGTGEDASVPDAGDADAGDAGPLADAAIRFAVFGDYGADSPEEADVALLVAAEDPDFLVTTGDNNYPVGSASTIDRNVGKYYSAYIHPYVGIYGEGSDENRFFPSLGNHDWETPDATPYRAYFTLPGNERYYDFVRGPVHVFVIDSDPREPDGVSAWSAQAAWLREGLAASETAFQVVVMHHPPMSSAGEHGSCRHVQWPFAAWGADAVLAGHDHVYEHVVQSGVHYVTTGLGGASRYGFDGRVHGSQTFFNEDEGALFVSADEEWADFRFLTRAREVIEEFSIPRSAEATVRRNLLPAGATWRYRTYGPAPEENWRAIDHDDSAWPTGAAPLGQGDSYLATELDGEPSDEAGVSTWFRTTFDAPDRGRVRDLAMGLRVDDGAIVWLNGVEILRDNMPSGEINSATSAERPRDGPREASFQPYGVDPALLVDEGNVLAIEVHQHESGPGDVALDVVLDATVADVLLPSGSTWRFTRGTPADGWTEPSFDDRGWEEGAAELPSDPVWTGIDPDPPPARFAARGRFDVADPADHEAVTLRLVRDDGAVVWVNGREVLRNNVPAGEIFPTSLAAFDPAPDYDQIRVETVLRPEWLVPGENVVAVALYQARDDPTRFRFDLELLVP